MNKSEILKMVRKMDRLCDLLPTIDIPSLDPGQRMHLLTKLLEIQSLIIVSKSQARIARELRSQGVA